MKYISIFALLVLNTDALHLFNPTNGTQATRGLPMLPPFYPWDNGVAVYDQTVYQRKIPASFESDAGDKLMHSIMLNYAIELRDSENKPSGKFYLDI